METKDYFCDKDNIRVLKKHSISYNGQYYNYSQLANILCVETNQKKTTIRRKLQNNWTIDEIIETPLNKWRHKN